MKFGVEQGIDPISTLETSNSFKISFLHTFYDSISGLRFFVFLILGKDLSEIKFFIRVPSTSGDEFGV